MNDAALDAHEHTEHAQHAAHENNPFISQVSITIALLAVVAAATASLETYESGGAIIEANKAVLLQDQATDQWGYYQAKGIKGDMFDLAAEAGGDKAASYLKKVKSEAEKQERAKAEATKLEKERDEAQAVSAIHERRHHQLGIAATLLEMGIAISTIAIITRKRWPWLISTVLGLAGAAVAGIAYSSLATMLPGF